MVWEYRHYASWNISLFFLKYLSVWFVSTVASKKTKSSVLFNFLYHPWTRFPIKWRYQSIFGNSVKIFKACIYCFHTLVNMFADHLPIKITGNIMCCATFLGEIKQIKMHFAQWYLSWFYVVFCTHRRAVEHGWTTWM